MGNIEEHLIPWVVGSIPTEPTSYLSVLSHDRDKFTPNS